MRIWLPEVVADLADLEDDKVLGREHVVEIVRVDLEQDRGHSSSQRDCFAEKSITSLLPL